ncbi:MAG: epoxide hydrolase family protein [Candidatus Limnocylindrales bacterium]
MSDAIHEFRISIPDADLDDLAHRLDEARWPADLPGDDWSRGVPAGYLRDLATYWRTGYDWRAHEATLNAFPQFVTEIDGQRIHFLHVRSSRSDATPLFLTHGYPSSFVEFRRLIGMLIEPEEGPAFHVVAPSLPGYGFSTPLSGPGWTMGRIAQAWAGLARRLGYERYGVHGGDIGAGVSGMVATADPEHVIGMHVVTDPMTAASAATFIPGLADGLDPADPVDRLALDRMEHFRTETSGYLRIQNSRPRTMGYGLNDSPLLQLAWIADSFHEWTDLPIDRDDLLTNVSLYWFTGSGIGAAQGLYEQAHAHDWGEPPSVPQGYAVFGADATMRKLMPVPVGVHWTEFERGGHFPALEAPEQVAADLRTFFGSIA